MATVTRSEGANVTNGAMELRMGTTLQMGETKWCANGVSGTAELKEMTVHSAGAYMTDRPGPREHKTRTRGAADNEPGVQLYKNIIIIVIIIIYYYYVGFSHTFSHSGRNL